MLHGKFQRMMLCGWFAAIPQILAPNKGIAEIHFENLREFDTVTSPNYLEAGDFNGDGYVDLAVLAAVYLGEIRFGDGAGNFDISSGFSYFDSTWASLAAGDVDNDGDIDLLAGRSSDIVGLDVILNDGVGNMARDHTDDIEIDGANELALGDFDKDGDRDCAALSTEDEKVAILFNTGAGKFGVVDKFSVGTDNLPEELLAYDLDDDEDLDLLVGSIYSPNLVLLINNGDGVFVHGPVSDPDPISNAALGDLDGDGDVDILQISGDGLQPLLNDGMLQFSLGISAWNYGLTGPVVLSDLDADGDLDAVVTDTYIGQIDPIYDGVTIFQNDGAAGLEDVGSWAGSAEPSSWVYDLQLVDVDADNDDDVVMVNQITGTLGILINDGVSHVGCDGDANKDGTVDPLDAGYVLARFGCIVGAGNSDCNPADQNGDGAVDPLDVGFVLSRFGECP